MKRSGIIAVFLTVVSIGIVSAPGSGAHATTWYVDCNAPCPGSGLPGDPFCSIQAALDACAPYDSVSVADGVCLENIVWPDTDGIRLYSRSGDPSACVVDGQGVGSVISATSSSGPLSLTIEGITVQNAGDPSPLGLAGIALENNEYELTATIANAVIQNNRTISGVKAAGTGDAPLNVTVRDSTISDTSHPSGYTSFGIGFAAYNGSLDVERSTISGTAGYGVFAMGLGENADIDVADSRIFGNYNAHYAYSQYGGGLIVTTISSAVNSHTVRIEGNEVFHNYGDPAAMNVSYGIVVYGPRIEGSVADNTVYDHASEVNVAIGLCVFAGSVSIDRNRLFNNRGVSAGPGASGGLTIWSGTSEGGVTGTYTVTNNIIASNTRGIFANTAGLGADISIVNDTVVDNHLVGIEESATGAAETKISNCIVGDWDSGTGAVDLVGVGPVTYSNIQDGPPPGAGNISTDPVFVDPDGPDGVFGSPDDDYHLTASSPCIDAGTALGAPSHDYDGDARPQPSGGAVDIGADEYLKGGCFVATAAFGSAVDSKIDVLRSLRDRHLARTALGRAFIAFYYGHSEPVAECIARHEWLRTLVRIMLLPVIGGVSALT